MDRKLCSLLSAAMATAVAGTSAQATLVAYFPVDSATDSSTFLNDVIDDAGHGVADGTSSNEDASIIFDATRGGDVLSTVNDHRYTAGTQDIDLAVGFTWALWVKSDSVANANNGSADVIIGSRNGVWNKVQPTGTQRYFDLGGYNIDDDTWHHIAYTGDTTGAAFYVDGLEVATDMTPFNNIQTVNDVMEIGGSSRFTEDWIGLMDDIGIWNERLSVEDIGLLAAGTAPDDLGGPPALPGDTDGDGDVDDSDLGTSFSNYTGPVGDVGKTAADGDNDGDGDVDDSDLGTSFSNYTGPIAVSVPEPTSLALLALGGLLAARRRRA